MTDNSELDQTTKKSFKRILIAILAVVLLAIAIFIWLQQRTLAQKIGPPAADLSAGTKLILGMKLSSRIDELTDPLDSWQAEKLIEITPGDSAAIAARKLSDAGILPNPDLFVEYLVYCGADRRLFPGRYVVAPGVTIPQLAANLTDPGTTLIRFTLLKGTRLEEIAALIPSSGLPFSAEAFLQAAQSVSPENHPAGETSMEGYMLAGSYEIARDISVSRFIQGFSDAFRARLSEQLLNKIAAKGLTLKQAAILSSMITREAMRTEEYPLVASVFLNRSRAGMPFQSDPTVQFALGWQAATETWWKNPLSQQDLAINSAYNSYLNQGFPPTPISNFAFEALEALADAPETDYYFFRLRCDGSALHNFAATYAEHQANACP